MSLDQRKWILKFIQTLSEFDGKKGEVKKTDGVEGDVDLLHKEFWEMK